MNYRNIAKLACQIMAIYYFILSINMIPSFIVTLVYFHDRINDMGQQISSYLAMSGPMLIASIILWVFADKISKLMAGDSLESTENISLDLKNKTVLAFVIMGMFILTRSIPDLTRLLSQFMIMNSGQMVNSESKAYIDYLTRIIADIVQILMGLWLLLGSRGIVKVLQGFRDFGKENIEVPKE